MLTDDPTAGDRHRIACFYPVGTVAGESASAANVAVGVTAAGLPVDPRSVI